MGHRLLLSKQTNAVRRPTGTSVGLLLTPGPTATRQSGGFSWRYRNLSQIERALRVNSYHPALYASAEFFYESQYGKWSDTAIYAGFLFPVGKHLEFNPYYEHQNNSGSSPNQQLNQLGLIINLYLSAKQE
jgi:hypothetical protein